MTEPEWDATHPARTVSHKGTPVHVCSQASFFLASMVGGLSSVCIKQLLLPIQVSLLDPRTTATSFALIASLGACAGLISAPLSGALSDRTTSRWGRRRPWLIVGSLIAVIGLITMARASTIPLLLIGEVVAQIGVDTLLATTTVLIPDQIPEHHRNGVAVLNGMAPIVGGVLGLLLVTQLTNPQIVWQGYVLLAVVSLGMMGLFVLIVRERPLSRDVVGPLDWQAFVVGLVRPLAVRDFTCVWLSRTLIFLSFTIVGAYTFFYLRQGIGLAASVAAQGVTTFQLLSTGVVIVSALSAGYLAGRVRRLKPLLIGGALVMAASLLLIALVPMWQAMMVASGFFGAGFGAFVGLDIAVALRVLPNETERGKDLGIFHTAIFLPLIVSPLIGAAILNTVHSFAVLFVVAALASVGAAGFIVPIKAVR
ncbi:MAG TPA: MFS transporter [Ktedonobacteraceae bacterium]|nr:MFS transporter [Ktedonobacteraceae bacterium]